MADKYDPQTKDIVDKYKSVIDNTTILGPKDLPFIMAAMKCVSTQWRSIGLQWGIHPYVLDKIEKEHPKDINSCFMEMIVEWLINHDEHGPKPTWLEVIVAMARRSGGENPKEAEKLAELCKAEGGSGCLSYVPEAQGVDDSELEMGAVKDIIPCLEPVRAYWKDIGIMLGVSYFFLCELSMSGRMAAYCMEKVIEKWLTDNNKNYGVPSWKKIVEVVGARVGGGNKMAAKEIADAHRVEGWVEEEEAKGVKRPHVSGEPEEAVDTKRPHLDGSSDGASESSGLDVNSAHSTNEPCEVAPVSVGTTTPQSPLKSGMNSAPTSDGPASLVSIRSPTPPTTNGSGGISPLPRTSERHPGLESTQPSSTSIPSSSTNGPSEQEAPHGFTPDVGTSSVKRSPPPASNNEPHTTTSTSSSCENRTTSSEGTPSCEGVTGTVVDTPPEAEGSELTNGTEELVHEADRRLTSKEHIKVLHYLKPIGGLEQLIELGQTLGLGRAPLTLRRSAPETLMGYLIESWIRRDYEVLKQSGEPTWRSLAKALNDIGMNGISQDIQKDHHFDLAM